MHPFVCQCGRSSAPARPHADGIDKWAVAKTWLTEMPQAGSVHTLPRSPPLVVRRHGAALAGDIGHDHWSSHYGHARDRLQRCGPSLDGYGRQCHAAAATARLHSCYWLQLLTRHFFKGSVAGCCTWGELHLGMQRHLSAAHAPAPQLLQPPTLLLGPPATAGGPQQQRPDPAQAIAGPVASC